MKEIMTWDNIHYFEYGGSSPCTGLACFEEDVATVGEDGRLILLTARQKQTVRRIEEADSCSLRSVCFLKHNEVLTGNLRGQMKVWDLKSSSDKPTSTFMLSGEQVCSFLLCIYMKKVCFFILAFWAENREIITGM